MALVSLVYCSTIGECETEQDFAGILEASHKNNPALGITGILFFSNRYFVQCLEGHVFPVNKLYQRICQDHRNRDSVVLHYDTIDKRRFGAWDMGYVGEEHNQKAEKTLFNYGIDGELNPYTRLGPVWLDILDDLSRVLTLK